MRNYVTLYYAFLTYNDPGFLFPTGGIALWDSTPEGVAAQVQNAQNNGPNVQLISQGKAFPLLDKDQVLFMCQQMGQLGVLPTFQADNTPRDTWKPGEGGQFDNYHGPNATGGVKVKGAAKALEVIQQLTSVYFELTVRATALKGKDKIRAIAAAASILKIIQDLSSQKITVAEAVAKAKKIVDSL